MIFGSFLYIKKTLGIDTHNHHCHCVMTGLNFETYTCLYKKNQLKHIKYWYYIKFQSSIYAGWWNSIPKNAKNSIEWSVQGNNILDLRRYNYGGSCWIWLINITRKTNEVINKIFDFFRHFYIFIYIIYNIYNKIVSVECLYMEDI